MQQIYQQAKQQASPTKRYTKQIGDERLMYVIRKGNARLQEVYLISYMFDTYRNDLVRTLFKRLLFVQGIVLLLSWIPSILLAKYLTKPLVKMEKRVQQMANREWENPLHLNRSDELGSLADSINKMRNDLLKQDQTQKSLLQHISHELKTPVMVIRSYAQSIQDGIYPKGDPPQTLDVIESEAGRLEKLIQDLLYLTKLDYLSTQKPQNKVVDLTCILEEAVDRLRWKRQELKFDLNLENIKVNGDPEQWRTAFENILDNQIRYAHSEVKIRSASIHDGTLIQVENDGEPIASHMIEHLFQSFKKGDKGNYGLGLAIVERIIKLHGSKVWVENIDQGVRFSILIPTKRTVT